MKFLVLCTLLLSIALFMATAQAQGGAKPDEQKPHHHHAVRAVRYAEEPQLPPKGEAGCCG